MRVACIRATVTNSNNKVTVQRVVSYVYTKRNYKTRVRVRREKEKERFIVVLDKHLTFFVIARKYRHAARDSGSRSLCSRTF